MKVKLIEHTQDPEQIIANSAAICFDAVVDKNSNKKRIKTLMSKRHLSALRFAHATFHITGISRVESHQHVRTAHAGFLQRSQRYVEETRQQTIRPPTFENVNADTIAEVIRAEIAAFSAYYALIAQGVPKEDARYVLPQATVTELVMTGNFQMYWNWLSARLVEKSQWEIRAVALEIAKHLARIAPNIFSHFLEEFKN